MGLGLLGLTVILALAACTDAGTAPASGEKAKRGQGMSEEIWKIYSGTESGVSDETKDAPAAKK
jgi:hypothetical protein